MYGTVAKMRLKPGMADKFRELTRQQADASIPGFVGEHVYRMDGDPDVLYLVVSFSDKDAYVKNAQSPGQDARYRELRELLAADPEWNDGEIIWSTG